jgi:hypothetical protein
VIEKYRLLKINGDTMMSLPTTGIQPPNKACSRTGIGSGFVRTVSKRMEKNMACVGVATIPAANATVGQQEKI